jgi:hypothetical protein
MWNIDGVPRGASTSGYDLVGYMIDLAMGDRLPAFYDIEIHKHRYAAWAASRGASVIGCRFSVECGRALLENCGFTATLCRPEQLPSPASIDDEHRRWRKIVIRGARPRDLCFTHGIAAKLINLYLKSRFVCGGHHAHERVRSLHPPIDSRLLLRLAETNFRAREREWRTAANRRWSKLESNEYEQLVALMRHSLKGAALWRIEEHWIGNA